MNAEAPTEPSVEQTVKKWPLGPEGERAKKLATEPKIMSDRELALALAEDMCRRTNQKHIACPLVAYLEGNSIKIQDSCRTCITGAASAIANKHGRSHVEIQAS